MAKQVTNDELFILSNLSYSKNGWFSDEMTTIKVEYDAEYQDFLVETDEKKTRRNRITKTQMDVTAWADSQIKHLAYQNKKVATFVLDITKTAVSITLELTTDEGAVATAETA